MSGRAFYGLLSICRSVHHGQNLLTGSRPVTLPRPSRRTLVAGIGVAVVAAMVGIGTTALAGTSGSSAKTATSPSINLLAKPAKVKKTKATAVVKDSYIVVFKDKKASKASVHTLSGSLS